jgi:hypothetical protein
MHAPDIGALSAAQVAKLTATGLTGRFPGGAVAFAFVILWKKGLP